MAPSFQSSFIPKSPVTEEVFKKKKAGILGVLAVSLFVSSIVISIGIYVYKGMLKNDIEGLQAELAQAENNIDKETINEMAQFGEKLNIAKLLVTKHQVISNFLSSLSSSTVSSVQFTELTYGNMQGSGLTIGLQGKADSYASIALQENVFSQNKYFKSLTFSDLNLSDKGAVSFKLDISVDPQISVYSP